MKTEMKKVWVYVESRDGKNSLKVSCEKSHTTFSIECMNLACAPVVEIEIAIPTFSDDELNKIIHGSLLEQLMTERDSVKREMIERLNRIESKISDLQCLDFKVSGDNNA
ncbi:MAG TPA: hypothetical protein VIC51_12365 [Psychromonas sp.]